MGKLALIYARSRNRYIGLNGQIPWSLPDEYAIFERTTLGHAVIMGRRTYEDHQYAFPNRLNIVVTRNEAYPLADSIRRSASLGNAITMAADYSDTTFVIGGTGLLAEAFPLCDVVFETVVDTDIEGDAKLPVFNFEGWQTEITERHSEDTKHAFAFTAFVHTRFT